MIIILTYYQNHCKAIYNKHFSTKLYMNFSTFLNKLSIYSETMVFYKMLI